MCGGVCFNELTQTILALPIQVSLARQLCAWWHPYRANKIREWSAHQFAAKSLVVPRDEGRGETAAVSLYSYLFLRVEWRRNVR